MLPLLFSSSRWPTITGILLLALWKGSIFSLPLQVAIPGLQFIPQPFNYQPLRFPSQSSCLGFLLNTRRGRSSVYLKLRLCTQGMYNMVIIGQQGPPKTQFLKGPSDNEKDKNAFELGSWT